MEKFLQLTINGLLLGGFYASMTVGFSTIWGVMRLINLAHGEFLMTGAFVAWFFFNPQREQRYVLGGDPAEVEGTIRFFMLGITVLVAIILSEFVVSRKRIPSDLQRRAVSLGISVIVNGGLYFIWRGDDFSAIELPMTTIVPVGLFLAFGFMLSHLLLMRRIGNLWLRHGIGHGVAFVAVYAGWEVWERNGLHSIDPFLSLVLIFPLFFWLGYMLQKLLLNRLVEGPYLTMLLVTFSISIILQNIGLQLYRADPRRINVDYGNAYRLGSSSLTVPPIKMITMVVSAGMLLGMVWFLKYTRAGYAIRAAAQHKMAARLMGIDINETYALTFGIALALTAATGAMMGAFQPITPVSGPPFTLRAFAIVALGGLGKVQGVVVGGLVLGLAESYIGGYVGLGWAIAMAFIMLVVMLVARPQGITGGLQPQEA